MFVYIVFECESNAVKVRAPYSPVSRIFKKNTHTHKGENAQFASLNSCLHGTPLGTLKKCDTIKLIQICMPVGENKNIRAIVKIAKTYHEVIHLKWIMKRISNHVATT